MPAWGSTNGDLPTRGHRSWALKMGTGIGGDCPDQGLSLLCRSQPPFSKQDVKVFQHLPRIWSLVPDRIKMILLNLRRDVRFIRRGKGYSLNKGDSLKMHWLRLLPILMLRLTAAIPAFGAGTGQPGWVEELDRTMVECGQKIDRAYPNTVHLMILI